MPNLLIGAVAFAAWTVVLLRRFRVERGRSWTWTRIFAAEYVVWLISLAYLAQAVAWPDVDAVRSVATVARAALLVSGVAFAVTRPRP